MMNKITIKLQFQKYLFKRAKPTSNGALTHTPKEWIGKKVIAIPVPINVTDRLIETTKDEKGTYHFTIQNAPIISKEVKSSTTTGRIYLPNEYIGYDMLIIEQPPYE